VDEADVPAEVVVAELEALAGEHGLSADDSVDWLRAWRAGDEQGEEFGP